MDVTIERCIGSVTSYAIIDAVTTIGVDDTCADIQVNYHWMPPWLTRNVDKDVHHYECQEKDHEMMAFVDFLPHRTCKLDPSFVECKLIAHRYEKVKHMHSVMSTISGHREGRFRIIRVHRKDPSSLCESSGCPNTRQHALAYINTVLAIKGIRVPKSKKISDHIEIKDRGPQLGGGSFRRLRRLLTSCAIRNTYTPRVSRLGDGKPLVKRRLRLKLQSDGMARCVQVKEKVQNMAEFYSIMQTSPTYYDQSAQLIPIGKKDSLPVTWYKVTVSKGTSIAIEGVMLKIIRKKEPQQNAYALSPRGEQHE